jgi:uncharacterized protein YkwD
MAFRFRLGLLILGLIVLSGSSITPKELSASEVLEAVNNDRAQYNLAALKLDPVLNLAALAKARDMVQSNYFAHTSPEGTEPWHWFKALGYDYAYAGENLAQGFENAEEMESSLMASPTHRANILSPFYSQIGVAVVNLNDTTLVVQMFGSQENQLSLKR